MDDQLEELLQEYMEKRTESVCLSEDLLTSARSSYTHRKKVRRRILTGCGAIGVVILVAGLVFGVALAQGGGQPSGSKVAKTGASASTTNAATDKGAMAIVLLRKALSVATPTKDEILHVKYRALQTNSTVEGGDTVEYWWTGDQTKYMSRNTYADAEIQSDSLEIYPGRFLNYTHISGSGTKSLWWDKTASGGFGDGTPGEFVKSIQDDIASGQAVEAGHDWIDRRDAVRIVVDQGVGKDMVIYYLDAQTYYPLECQSISDQGELVAVCHYDVYESLPATAENLKVFDEKAFLASHPGLPLQGPAQ